MKIINKATKVVISQNVKYANNFFKRFKGLMGKPEISEDEALIISPCNNVHMFFMKFPIDVLFLDEDNIVCYIQENLQPWKISKFVKGAKYVIELPSGKVKEKNIMIHSHLQILAEKDEDLSKLL